MPSLVAREQAFLEAGRQAGIAIDFRSLGQTSYQTGLDLGTALMARPDPPDGVFCTTDLIACGLMDAARHRFGVAIPGDLSVIGFDDIAQAGWSAYDLTTFRQPVAALAGTAVAALDPKAGDETRLVPTQLVVRRSVRPASFGTRGRSA